MSEHSFESFFRSLPHSPSLDRLKEEAKSLKKRYAGGEAGARSFVDFHRERSGVIDAPFQLADAQFAVARSYGFKSWPRLKAYVDSHSLNSTQRGELLLNTLFTDNHTLLQELYDRRDLLPDQDFYVCAALGEVERVESHIERDPSLATQLGGPKQTQALTYAAFARFGIWDETFPSRQQRVVSVLLANGADPNASVLEKERGKDGAGRLSSLYGCCRFPGNPEVARKLLDAGANADDGESLYHASELNDSRCLELLFAAGVPKASQEFCIRRALDGYRPKAVELYLKNGTDPNHLDWALFRGHGLDIISLLVEHGADVNRVCENHWLLTRIQGLTPIQIAERAGAGEVVEYLLTRGAHDQRTAKDKLLGACARADADCVHSILRASPNVIATLSGSDHSYFATFARMGRIEPVNLMLDAGFDIEARADDLDATALLYAATNGDVPMLRLLIERGARLDVKHKYDGAPLGTCIYCAAHHRNAQGDYAGAARVLIEAGEKATDELLEFAVANDLDEIAEVLKNFGATM